MNPQDTAEKAAFNISSYLKQNALDFPYRKAVLCPTTRDSHGRMAYTHLTFSQLEKESDRFAQALVNAGLGRGDRTILMVKPGINFFILTFALFKAGAVPVVVDPGMGVKRMLGCLQESQPDAFIGIPLAHLLRLAFPKYFSSVKTCVTVGKKWFWGGVSTHDFQDLPDKAFSVANTRREDTAAILFTTGSTGPAKGVVYTHGTFDAQIQTIRQHFNFSDEETDLPTFPLFALFDPALGITAVIPDMDFTKPAKVNPHNILSAIQDHGVTSMFASPALLNTVGAFGQEHKVKLPSLKRVVSAGAPVFPANIKQFSSMLTEEALIHTPYGATEAVPIISMDSREILAETADLSEKGYGLCVGYPLQGMDVKIIRITDSAIDKWSEDLQVEPGEVGEIIVKGDLVTAHYFKDAKADKLAKIAGENRPWHRMGDLAWQDSKGRIWFCGRKCHRVITKFGPLYTIPCESLFNNHPLVFRSALVGIGKKPNQIPAICIEPIKNSRLIPKDQLKDELIKIARANESTKNIHTVLFHNNFPVDIRHNAKIFREELAVWAEGKMNRKGKP
ncbi:MAG: AMP-binding protein [Desulfobacteraceae bacterium]|nr:AMP-binding protein [Pseudomonadota bacterium]MCG2753559.1 AMP-binding protein [Desulfobacteraceae bacterium]